MVSHLSCAVLHCRESAAEPSDQNAIEACCSQLASKERELRSQHIDLVSYAAADRSSELIYSALVCASIYLCFCNDLQDFGIFVVEPHHVESVLYYGWIS